MFLLLTLNDVTPEISAVATLPLIVLSLSIPRSINACSKLASGIAVV